MTFFRRGAAILLLMSAAVTFAEERRFDRRDYEKMQEWNFATSPVLVDVEGFTFTTGHAIWRLESGSLRFTQPVQGEITGWFFEGKGSMRMEIHDRVELEQLRRFTGDPSLDRLEVAFDQAVLRSSRAPLSEMAPEATSWTDIATARRRHAVWLEQMKLDPDARTIAALTDPTDLFTIVDLKSDQWDWITWIWDEKKPEEIRVSRVDKRHPEVWLSLDRSDEARPDGRPGKDYSPRAMLRHLDARVDLTRRSRSAPIGKSRTQPILARLTSTVYVEPVTDGWGSLQFSLHPQAKLDRVLDEQGRELDVLRDHIGSRALYLDKRMYDSDVVVLLGAPARKGTQIELTFEYELEIANYAGGNSWYPTLANNNLESHTARLELTAPKRYTVYSMGTKVESISSGATDTTVWVVDKPTPMVTFSVGNDFREKRLDFEDQPSVLVFGPVMGIGRGNMPHNVAVDVANSVKFFTWLFDHPLPDDTIHVTSIAAGHGQAFDGFLHMSEMTFDSEHPGASELFRAHEVAHLWWGHQVQWSTYRDQWLSESFAEYAAMMFVESTVKNGPKLFDEMLEVYGNLLKGSLRGSFSKFARPWLIEMRSSERGRIGPIDVGYRAGTSEIPAGYLMQAYYKGPLVIHMLRVMLRNRTGSEELFLTVLRDFVASHARSRATTEDLQRILEKHFPGNWGWFFDQWIYGAEIPTLAWKYDTAPTADGSGTHVIRIHVRKTDVPAEFGVPVPVRVELEDGRLAMITVVVSDLEQTHEYTLPGRPKKLDFNADHGVLAIVRRM